MFWTAEKLPSGKGRDATHGVASICEEFVVSPLSCASMLLLDGSGVGNRGRRYDVRRVLGLKVSFPYRRLSFSDKASMSMWEIGTSLVTFFQ